MEVKKKSKKKVTKKTSKNIKKEIINIKDKKIKLFIFLVCLITLLLVLVGAAYAYYNVAVNTTGGTGAVSAKSDEVGNVSLSGDGGSLHINLKPKEISNILGGAFYGTDSEEGYSLVEDKIEVAKIEATSLPEKVKYICTFDIKVKPKEGDLTGVTGGEVLFSTISVDLNDIETGRLAFSTLTEEKVYHAKTIVYSGDINYLRVSARITSSSENDNEAWLQKINGSFSVSTDNLKCTAEKDNTIDEVETYKLSGKLVDENGNALSGYASLMSEPRTIILGDDGTFEIDKVEAGLHNLYYMGEVNPDSLTKEEIKAQAKSETTFRTRIAKLEDKIKLENRINFLNFVIEDDDSSFDITNVITNGTISDETLEIAAGETKRVTVTPEKGYYLSSVSCTNGYTTNARTGTYAAGKQKIDIKNNNVENDSTCTYSFAKLCTVDQYWTYSYTGSSQILNVPCSGVYELEVWGAQGGTIDKFSTTSGLGGYSKGNVTLDMNEYLYIHVGGKGTSGKNSNGTTITGGWNGGGNAYTGTNGSYYSTGGGATDFSIKAVSGSNWNNTNHLYSRILVAGGGGGHSQSDSSNGGAGGGTTGINGEGSHANGYGGTHTAGGLGGSDGVWYARIASKFGVGGNGGDNVHTAYGSSGGGGGWYGGGSGYVYTSGTASYCPSGCLLDSNYYLTNTSLIAGNLMFNGPSGIKETGHEGNGYARITLISKSE